MGSRHSSGCGVGARLVRGATALCATLAVALPLAPAAHAQLPFGLDNMVPDFGSSQFELPGLDGFTIPTQSDFQAQGEAQAWRTRGDLHRSADQLLPAPLAQQAKDAVDRTLEAVYPGIIARHSGPRPAPNPAPAPAPQPAPAPSPRPTPSPCPKEARACVDADKQVAWLQDGKGHRVSDVIRVSTGADGYDTPPGRHYVNRKVKYEVSREFYNAPMPNSVYFTRNGIAFHGGDPEVLSHGCVHVPMRESERYFNHLNIGDLVYVWGDVDYGVPNGHVRR
ncbi:L,D-transpeptidase [Corynebacterium sp. 11A]|uniref:L,D-transpeptidase n=1 Tax=Corynebacterium sp. 11A TaxID=2080510 RepID=UPI00178C4387|nr:L,D-transpeptidase [Corynebacterium sp. 11A]